MNVITKLVKHQPAILATEVNIAFELFKTSQWQIQLFKSPKLLKRGSSVETMNLIYEFRN